MARLSFASLGGRLELFPVSTQVMQDGQQSELSINGISLQTLAQAYGTPLYVYDQNTLDCNVASYRTALTRYYPGRSGITYAGKAFLCLAMAQWVRQQGIRLDCTGAGELYAAAKAGLLREQIVVHGVNKSQLDLETAIQQAGTLVVDNLVELARIIDIFHRDIPANPVRVPDLWLRLRPGTAVQTHANLQTGQEDSKFGFSPEEFKQARQICQQQELPLNGLHFHLGSHLHSPAPLCSALETALKIIHSCYTASGWLPGVICVGGGWGVAYHEADLPHPAVDEMVEAIAKTLISGCRGYDLPLFHLQLEPGCSLVAQAGVAIYKIGAVKHTPHRRYLLLDGGLADNPRPAMYQARYTALPVRDPLRSPTGPAWLAGPYCESGDILIEDLPMAELEAGEYVAIPVSGAYQLSMGSNYNGAYRPAVVWLNNQIAVLIQARESAADLYRRDSQL
jgi:diaminopimelate decarboxylase